MGIGIDSAKLLLTAVLLSATIAADASASGAPRHDALVLANAYGDTVWFESDTLTAGSATISVGADADKNADRARFCSVVPRASSIGIVLMIGSDSLASPRESPGALIERLATIGFARRARSMFPAEVSPAVYEPGCFDRWVRWACGWTFRFEAGSRPPVRMTFVVVGKPLGGPTARRGPDGAPMPITEWTEPIFREETASWTPPRFYDLSSEELRATARVIGDVIVDFDRRLLVPLETKGTSVARLDMQKLFTWRR